GGQRRISRDVVLLVAVESAEDLHALEVEADVVLVGYADAAVELRGLARDEEAALGELLLRDGDGGLALGLVVRVGADHGEDGGALAQLDLDEHVGHAVLKGLK